MGTRRARTARSIALGGVLWAAIASFAAGGCELAIGGAVPPFECDPADPSTCPGGQICSPSSHRCVESCTSGGCLNSARCDADSGLCVVVDASAADSNLFDVRPTPDVVEAAPPVEAEAGPPEASMVDAGPCGNPTGKAIGCPCGGPSDCASSVCGDELTLTPDIYAAADNNNSCTQPCCTSNDCPSGSVCFASAAGGNYCVLPQWLERTGGLGTAQGGASCGAGSDCRSGLCASNGRCGDTCCSTATTTSECASGTTCAFSAFPGMSFDTHESANCGTKSGSGQNDDDCSSNSSCQSELCDGTQCSDACRSGTDCGSFDRCTYLEPDSSSDLAAACVPATGNILSGHTCDPTDDQCETGFCNGATDACVDVCFTDADCATSGGTCQPTLITFYVMGTPAGSRSVLACAPGS